MFTFLKRGTYSTIEDIIEGLTELETLRLWQPRISEAGLAKALDEVHDLAAGMSEDVPDPRRVQPLPDDTSIA